MDDFINGDRELKQKAWNLHFANRRTNNKLKLTKKKNKKYVVKWVKQKDKEELFERWTKTTVPNEKYNSEDNQMESVKINRESLPDIDIYPETKQTRRSYRLNLQNILNVNASKKNYIDPSSDLRTKRRAKKKTMINRIKACSLYACIYPAHLIFLFIFFFSLSFFPYFSLFLQCLIPLFVLLE
ncbi:conserved Plasmodium protein, unknown function [Plasmodium malariae]|uniref:Uncharacterized protein n=1 Tax=Plasmodium malariae TaxID=5858 RepID=A0A1C3KE32_PLAMA|nr:conserved Plasmodium protein, unknown function [Plasmodium malariae]